MGKASSNKKVARAAKAGGGRARAAGERNFLFPAALAVVVVLGTLLVVYARENRSAEALEAPLANVDHWHASFAFYICDGFVPDVPEFVAPQNGGNHTHGDGIMHLHPFSPARAGENATLENFLEDAGEVLGSGGRIDEDRLEIPGREPFVEGEDTCEGLDGDPIVQVAVWESARDALDGGAPGIVTDDFGRIRFLQDGQAYTIAFAPEGADIPPPPTTSDLSGVGADLGVPSDEVPDDADFDGTGANDPSADEPTGQDPGDDTTAEDPSEDSSTEDSSDDTTPADTTEGDSP